MWESWVDILWIVCRIWRDEVGCHPTSKQPQLGFENVTSVVLQTIPQIWTLLREISKFRQSLIKTSVVIIKSSVSLGGQSLRVCFWLSLTIPCACTSTRETKWYDPLFQDLCRTKTLQRLASIIEIRLKRLEDQASCDKTNSY